MSTNLKKNNNSLSIPIYLDYSSTTPVDKRVATKMSECLTLDGAFGNPASRSHSFGWDSDQLIKDARKNVADLIKCDTKRTIQSLYRWERRGRMEREILILVQGRRNKG